MGIPRHYSLELPERSMELIDELWPIVSKEKLGAPFGGPLTTTFLLSLATPMIALPVERLLKQYGNEGIADDRVIDPMFAKSAQLVIADDRTFGDCEFFDGADGWAYAYHPSRVNLARGLPEAIAQRLADPAAKQDAAGCGAKTAVFALRNALAHGVIAYLDADGRSTYGGPARMFAFMGEHRENRQFVGLHVLRISEEGFRSFLRRWVLWLQRSGLSEALAA